MMVSNQTAKLPLLAALDCPAADSTQKLTPSGSRIDSSVKDHTNRAVLCLGFGDEYFSQAATMPPPQLDALVIKDG